MSRGSLFQLTPLAFALGITLLAPLRADDAAQPTAATAVVALNLPGLNLPAPAADMTKDEAEKHIWEALQRPVSAEYTATPLKDVVAYLGDKLGVSVLVDKKALEAVGAEPESPVTIHVANVQARSALNLMLQPMDLTWTIRDEVLLITTPEEAGSKLTVRVYALHDLIGRTAVGKPGPDLETFVEGLQNTVAPESWDNVGGKGSAQGFGAEPILMIAQTLQIHDEIEQLIAQLRAVRNGGAK